MFGTYKTVDYLELIGPFIEAIKTLDERVTELEAQLAAQGQ